MDDHLRTGMFFGQALAQAPTGCPLGAHEMNIDQREQSFGPANRIP